MDQKEKRIFDNIKTFNQKNSIIDYIQNEKNMILNEDEDLDINQKNNNIIEI